MDLAKLKEEQEQLAKLVVINNKITKVKTVAGCDVIGIGNDLICSIAVLDYETLKLVDSATAREPAKIRYMPGFMGFSHGPIIVNTFMKLKEKPDVMIVKGHGIAHPRRLGLASQIGLQLNLSTIGVGSELLCGKVQDGKIMFEGEVRGAEYHTREFSNPVYVSPGHMISLNKSVEIVSHLLRPPHKMPEPIFVAHKLAIKLKKQP